MYLEFVQNNNLKTIYALLTNERDVLLSDIIEIARNPLPNLKEVINGLIEHLKTNAQHDKLLVDVLFVKGGMEEIKNYAYTDGKNHPPIFLYYYQYAKEQKLPHPELIQITLDGIKIIPQKYQTRSLLSLDLIEMAKKSTNKDNLTLGHSSAFYSRPTIKNLTYFLDFITSRKMSDQCAKLKEYLAKADLKKLKSDYYSHFDRYHNLSESIYSLNSRKINSQTLIIGRYILEGIEPFLSLVKPANHLGFSGSLKYIAVIISLILKSIAQSHNALVIDTLVDHYCCDETSDERNILKNQISNKANSLSDPKTYLLKSLHNIESLAIKRVTHILENKLRGDYESACLLLVACAEAKEILGNDGNKLIQNIDTQFKRFSAFRKPLKDLTSNSKYLITVR